MSLLVLIADDHFPVRYGLEILTREILGNNTRIDFAKDFDEVVAKIKEKKYDILLSDIIMPGMDCLAMMEQALTILPQLKVLCVSVNPKEIFASRYMKAGAYGYVCKSDSDEELKKAIRSIYLGKRYFPEISVNKHGDSQMSKEANSLFDLLSKREFSVMLLLLEGLGVIEIAHKLNFSPSTASTYRGRIFEKLKIKGLVELSNMARANHIVIDK
ncbi:MAG TPA: response regulator transcription factor [Arachidicoccus sp.]|nr:response regulator transcription factor [Arachidicoccus sp.]